MKKCTALTMLSLAILTASCVSKKKYVALETDYNQTRSSLQKTQLEKEEAEAKLAKIEDRVASYNSKIQSLTETNNNRLERFENVAISPNDKAKMRKTLANVDQSELEQAKTLEDSLNLAISYNLKKSLDSSLIAEGEQDDITVDIDETVVMITISDKLLFRSGSYRINPKANNLLERLATVINSEPALEVMVEGHTDSQTVKPGSYVKDNWELSVERASAVIRKLQDSYNVDPKKMIAAGRSSFHPLTTNDDADGRASNRRTRIVILPNLDKFLALLSSN